MEFRIILLGGIGIGDLKEFFYGNDLILLAAYVVLNYLEIVIFKNKNLKKINVFKNNSKKF
jgi:hypothetical protein